MDPAQVPPRRWAQVLAHRDRLLHLARARVGAVDDAEDVVQEAMLRCATFDGLDEDRVGPFLTSVTLRLCVDEHRRRERDQRLALRLPLETPEPGADEPIVARAEAQWAAEVVGALPAAQQAIISARADGMSIVEISHHRRITYKAVESAVSRARTTVRRALATTAALIIATRRHVESPALASVGVAVAIAVGSGGAPVSAPHAPPAVVLRQPAPGASHVVAAGHAHPVASSRPAVASAVTQPPAPTVHTAKLPSDRDIQKVGEGRLYYNEHDGDYTTLQRIEHCVEYGVSLGPPIHCRYPDEPKDTP